MLLRPALSDLSSRLELRLIDLLARSLCRARPDRPEPADNRSRSGPARLIVGLGNPGKSYERNRHNVGFMVVDALAEAAGTRVQRKLHNALVADVAIADTRVLLAKPQTYMNLSGQAVSQLLSWYKLTPADVLVIYDDLDLPLGKLRVREQGSAGGHRGMQSVIDHLGSQGVPRIRVGIGRPVGEAPERYVLKDFLPDEWPIIADAIARATDAVRTTLSEGLVAAMTRFNN